MTGYLGEETGRITLDDDGDILILMDRGNQLHLDRRTAEQVREILEREQVKELLLTEQEILGEKEYKENIAYLTESYLELREKLMRSSHSLLVELVIDRLNGELAMDALAKEYEEVEDIIGAL